jgi:hypothetical protein
MMLLGEISELSLELAIEGQFDESIFVVTVESPKSMLTPFGAPNTQQELWRCSLVRRGRSAARGRTVRDLAQGLGFPA